MLNSHSLKKDFPIFVHNPHLVYLDSTATSLKPQSVIDKVTEYYEQYSANVHRGIYAISEKATAEYEKTREIVGEFIHANRTEEIIFTRSTTEAINLLAYSLGRQIVQEEDEIVTTVMEHHSNFVPWQVLASESGAVFKVVDITDDGQLDLGVDTIKKVITRKTKILSLTYVSNVLGTINPVKEIIREAKKINPEIITIVDAAQAMPHMKVNVQELGCDFLAFSSHKMLGPTGVGILWGTYSLLQNMFPFQYGGEMIQEVSIEKTTFKEPPHKFEAGTPDIANAVAFKESIRYLQKTGMDSIRKHEIDITRYAMKTLQEAFGNKIRILGPSDAESRCGIVAFTYGSYHPHDVAQILDEDGIAIRAGHHCALPLHKRLNITASSRVSFYLYNDRSDVDKLIEGLKKVEKTLRR